MSVAETFGRTPTGSLRQRLNIFSSRHRSTTVIVGMSLAILAMYMFPQYAPFTLFQSHASWLDAFANASVFILLALGLNVVIGFAGLLDLGYAAFFAIGAYTYAYGASPFSGNDFPFIPMLVAGAVVAAIFGIILGAPTLRLRGDYLAIMTLGFGEIVPLLFLNLPEYTNGTNGISGIFRPEIPFVVLGASGGIELGVIKFGAITPTLYFLLGMIVVTVAMVLLYRLQDSRIGRAWAAVREDELAASASGINTVTTKLLAFALGATTAGFAGVFTASKLSLVSPDQFQFTVSFTVLAMVIIGGMGNIWGVALGAFIVFVIQTVLLTRLNSVFTTLEVPILSDINFTEYTLVLYGLALVLMMLFRPEGFFPSQRRRRELHAAEELGEEGAAAEVVGAMGATPGSDELLGSADESESVGLR
jgi:ABC-type branched-subunit amino acid transport system permease subunit